jgi:hypothetical protein
MEKIIERLKKLTNKQTLLMNSPYVELSFLQADNSVKKKLLEELINSDDLKTKLTELYTKEIKREIELNEINDELKTLLK